ncbi:MAG: hypothetical protein JWO47_497 [Candidatus Saccharibacteria bacterium]|nr:hypothetical protein [Candidatus Saccharibacteria bacterium]
MDFLDPKRKKSHRRRLLLGYLLMAVALSLAAWLVLVSAQGFSYDRKTGDIIQNGTVFVDSQPVSANVYLDGTIQGNRTSTRLVLPGSKQYSIKLTADGYRDWKRTFTLTGGSIERLVYPLLVPKTLATSENQLYASAPLLTTQSIDKRWLMVQQPGQTYVFDVYDLNTPSAAPATLTIPASILTDPTKPATLTALQWAGDNKHLLMQRSYDDTSEFLMVDITNIASSLSINTTLTVAPSSVTLRDKKPDQIYIYDATGGVVRQGDLKNRTVSGAIVNNVIAYRSYGPDILLYATKTGADTGKVDVRIRENDRASYLLKTVTEAQTYLFDVDQFDGTPYYAVGTNLDDAVFVYTDPLPTLKGQQNKALLIPAVLRLPNPQFVSFSPDSHLIAAQSGTNFVVYDIEGDRQFKVSLPLTDPTQKVAWMDSFRFKAVNNNQSYITDFEGSNEQTLVPSLLNGAFFSPDSKTVFTLAPSKTVTGRTSLTQTSLVKK